MIDFCLWAECENEGDLQQLKKHFDNLKYTLLNGRTINFLTGIDDDEIRGLVVIACGTCEHGSGAETLEEILETTETAAFLYHRLLTAPDFRFACVGWDAYKTQSDWLFDSARGLDDDRWLNSDYVVSDRLYHELGAPEPFKKFRDGYMWQSYKGETYQPLFSSDQKELNKLVRKLLPYD